VPFLGAGGEKEERDEKIKNPPPDLSREGE